MIKTNKSLLEKDSHHHFKDSQEEDDVKKTATSHYNVPSLTIDVTDDSLFNKGIYKIYNYQG